MLMWNQEQSSKDQEQVVTSKSSNGRKWFRTSNNKSSNVVSTEENSNKWSWFRSSNARSSNIIRTEEANVRTDAEEVSTDDISSSNEESSNANEKGSNTNKKSSNSNKLELWGRRLVVAFEWVITFRWIVVLARWLVATGGNIAESAFLVSTVWVTIEIMAPALVKWIVPENIIALNNQLAVVAFTVLPELIIWTALATCYEHWKLARSSKRWDERLWAIGYSIPTAAFLVMTVVTLTSFVSLESLGKGAPQATGWWLVIRCMAGWIYGTISILYSKRGGKRLSSIMESQSANIAKLDAKLKSYSSNVLALQKDKLELQELLSSNQKELVAARLQLASGKVLTTAQRQDAITILEVANDIESVIANDAGSNVKSSNANGLQSSNSGLQSSNNYNAAGSNAKSSNANGLQSSNNYNDAGSNVKSSNSNAPVSTSTPDVRSSNNANSKKVTTLKSSNTSANDTDAISTPVLKKSSNVRSSTYIKLKEAAAKNAKEGTNKTWKTIVAETGVAYSTANLHKQEIYSELKEENANA